MSTKPGQGQTDSALLGCRADLSFRGQAICWTRGKGNALCGPPRRTKAMRSHREMRAHHRALPQRQRLDVVEVAWVVPLWVEGGSWALI